MGFVHIPDARKLSEAGFGDVSHVPIVFEDGHVYSRIANRFLRERALLEWPRNQDPALQQAFDRGVRFPKQNTLQNLARYLLDFFQWCDVAELSWTDATYKLHILDGYQSDLTSGRWPGVLVEMPGEPSPSRELRPLKPGTVNQRVAAVCDFLTWASACGHRAKFDMQRRSVRVPHHGIAADQPRTVSTRVGAVRKDPRDLRLPTQAELNLWLRSVRARWGYTKELMCRLALGAATRRKETVLWRTDYLSPIRSEWRVIDSKVMVRLTDGCKNDKPRDIFIDHGLAVDLDEYRTGRRMKAIARLSEGLSCVAHSDRLFLSEADARPISYQRFYDAYTQSVALPFAGWSPHLARHYWACTTLLRLLVTERHAQFGRGVDAPHQWVSDNGADLIKVVIAPQLGHIDEDTTELYLKWARQSLASPSQYLDWLQFLEGDA